MFEEATYENILNRMLSRVSDDFDKREGAVIYDALAPAAFEMAELYAMLDMMTDEAFGDSASYYYLAKRAAERGVYPKEETKATCKLVVEPANTPIALGDRFNLNDLNYTVTSTAQRESGIYTLQCETAGTVGNQQLGNALPIETANDINMMTSAKITEILIPGEDEEDVEALRERYFSSFNNESFGGNKADYITKINDIDGVGGCKVSRAWEGRYYPALFIPTEAVTTWYKSQITRDIGKEVGEWLMGVYGAAESKLLTVGGTVECRIITSEYKAPTSHLIETVQQLIDPHSGEGDGLAPIGHVVNVKGVQERTINITFDGIYSTGSTFETVKSSIENTIDSYFLELAKTWATSEEIVVRLAQIEAHILLLNGIIDIKNLKMNGYSENIVLSSADIPVRGDISG